MAQQKQKRQPERKQEPKVKPDNLRNLPQEESLKEEEKQEPKQEQQSRATPVSVMLKRAESWRESGKVHQAIATYFKLVENFPDTDEASKAEERLLGLAQELEGEGKVYAAMGICDRLAAPPLEPATSAGRGPGHISSPMGRSMGKPLVGKILGPIL